MRTEIKTGPKSIALLLIITALLGGCSNLGYYMSSVRGQMALWQRVQPIDALLDSRETAAPLKQQLSAVLRIREFASRELGLPDNQSYRQYADLERQFVVWNIFATDEFSVAPREWCFLFAGCVDYRGYFAKRDAEKFAHTLHAQGLDVYIGGVAAYSTLGWFDDPVLNTFIHYPETELARIVFHELSHQLVYVHDDSVFNESFAVTVEEEGMRRWLKSVGSPQQNAAFEAAQQRKKGFIALVVKSRTELEKLFASRVSDADKRSAKQRIFQALRDDYQQLKKTWGGFSRYDKWFEQNLNNAHLASIAVYTQLVPAFQALLTQNGGDLSRFYEAVKKLGSLSEDARMARLNELKESVRQESRLNKIPVESIFRVTSSTKPCSARKITRDPWMAVTFLPSSRISAPDCKNSMVSGIPSLL